MNKENVERLIGYLKSVHDDSFQMARWWWNTETQILEGGLGKVVKPQCGTAACIAGHIALMLGQREFLIPPGRVNHEVEPRWFTDLGSEFLGLTRQDAEELFQPGDIADRHGLEYITRVMAIKTLEVLLETGTVDWSHAEAELEESAYVEPEMEWLE